MSKVSIIVPVYNVPIVLFARCIQSLVEIDLNDYEIIVVNDGSDAQAIKDDEYNRICKKYSIIKYIYINHGGVVSARLTGLKVAEGTYISFVDADDWVDAEFYKSFVNVMDTDSSVDICVGGMVRSYPNNIEERICSKVSDRKMPMDMALEEMVSFSVFRWELCGKLYRNKLFLGISDERIQVYDDLNWNWDLFSKAKYVWYSGKFLYHYYMNPYSATQGNNLLPNNSLIVFRRIWNSQISNLQLKKQVYTHYAKNIFHNLQWLLLEDFTKNNHRYEIEKYFKEFLSIYQELNRLIDVSDLDYPDKKIVEISFCGYNEFCKYFRECILSFSRIIINLSKKYKRIYVYGTGNVSKYVSAIMQMYDIPIFMYVVSDGHGNILRFKDKLVKHFSELTVERNNDLFILSMLGAAQETVSMNLEKRRFRYITFDAKMIGFE